LVTAVRPPEWYREPGTLRWKKIWTTTQGDIVSEFGTPPPLYRKPEGGLFYTESPSVSTPVSEGAFEAYVRDLLAQGRTPQTVETLTGLGATEADIAEFFGEVTQAATFEEARRALDDPTISSEVWVARYGHLYRIEQQEQLHDLLETLFPGRVTGVLGADLQALSQYISNAPDAFWEDIQTLGRTPEVEALLRLIPWRDTEGEIIQITEEDLVDLFGESALTAVVPLSSQVPMPQPIEFAVPFSFPKTEEERVANQRVFKQYRERGGNLSFDQWRREQALSEAQITGELREDVFRKLAGLPLTAEAKQLRIDFANKSPLAAQFLAGWGDVIGTAGSALQWLGQEELAKNIKELAKPLKGTISPPEMPPLDWKSAADPAFWSNLPDFLARNTPFTLALVPAMIAGYTGGTAVAGAIGLGAFWTTVLGAVGATSLSRPLEGVLEAAGAFDEAISRDMTSEQASKVAQDVFLKNLILSGWDIAQLATAFLPIPAKILANPFLKAAIVGGKVIVTGLTEAGEEAVQEIFQRQALGDPIVLDEDMKLAMLLGGVMGSGMGGTGAAFTTIIDRTVKNIPQDMQGQFFDDMTEAMQNGLDEQKALLVALEELAKTTKGIEIIEFIVQDVQKEDAQMQIEASKERQAEKIEPITFREEFQLKSDIADLKAKLPTAPVEERAALQRRIEILEADLARGEALRIPEAVPEVKLPEELKSFATNAIKLSKEEFLTQYQVGLNEQNLTRRETAQRIDAYIKRTLKITPAQFYDTYVKAEQVIPKPPAVEPVAPVVEEVAPERIIYDETGSPINPDETIPQDVADTVPIVRDIGAKERVRPTRKVFEKMGLYEEFKGIQEAEVLQGEARQVFAKKLKEVNKWVDKKRRHIVFRELDEAGSQVGLTFNEKRAVAWFKKFFDEWADTLNLPQNKRVKNYITHIFEADIAAQLKTKHPLDIAMVRALEYRTPKTIFNPFLQERLGATVGLIEDPFAAASAYESKQLRVFYYEPLLQKLAAIANAETTPQAARNYLQDYAQRMTGKPSKLDQEINNTLKEFGEKIAKLPGGAPFARFLTRGNPAGMASYNFTSALYTLWLGFKPTSAIRNLSQHTLIMAEVGPLHFNNGISLRFTEEGKAALDNSLVWRSRRAAFLPGIDDSFASRWVDKFRETALWMFRAADAQNVKDAFLAGYSEAKTLLPEANRQVWIERGDEVAADTQYLYTKMNSMALSQTSIGRVFSVLTTWTVNWMELMTKWVSRRPSRVYLEHEKATGQKVKKANWSTSYKAILMYMVIVGLGYLIKEESRLKAWEYTGITSIRYLADVIGGDFPGLSVPGAVASMVAGFITDDERMFKQGWYEFRSSVTPGIIRQLENVASGERDWLTLFFYLEGKDWKIKKLKNKWEKGWKEYDALAPKDRDDYRKDNPLIEAQMFVTGKFTTLSSDAARAEVLRLIEEHKLDTEMIDGYEKVFGVDTDEELAKLQKTLGEVGLTEKGEQKLKENGELDYFTTGNFASEVNKLLKVVGRYRIEKDGNALAIEFLRAQDLWVPYEDLTDEAARVLFRQQFPDVEAQLYLWGKISTFKNPKSAEVLLGLMDKYGIPPEAIPAFLDNPEKYDELFTPIYELKTKWFDKSVEYEVLETDEERAQFKVDNPKWVAGMRRIEAIEKEIVSEDTYVDWYTNPDIKRPKEHEGEWYEDDWYLQEHDDFYQEMIDKGIWKPRNFDKVPTREVFELYKTWQLKDLGNARRDMEARYPELDQWLHIKFGTMLESERNK